MPPRYRADVCLCDDHVHAEVWSLFYAYKWLFDIPPPSHVIPRSIKTEKGIKKELLSRLSFSFFLFGARIRIHLATMCRFHIQFKDLSQDLKRRHCADRFFKPSQTPVSCLLPINVIFFFSLPLSSFPGGLRIGWHCTSPRRINIFIPCAEHWHCRFTFPLAKLIGLHLGLKENDLPPRLCSDTAPSSPCLAQTILWKRDQFSLGIIRTKEVFLSVYCGGAGFEDACDVGHLFIDEHWYSFVRSESRNVAKNSTRTVGAVIHEPRLWSSGCEHLLCQQFFLQ